MNSNKKLTEARGIPQALKRQTARQFKPVVAQLKTGISAQSIKRPIAPAVYRPQPAGLPTQGGSLSLVASGTEICTYCRRLIRTFCKYYGLTWADDPQHEAK